MEYTSAQANKLLKKLNSDYKNLISVEHESCSFMAAVGENLEEVRPAYDYEKMQQDIWDLAEKIRKVKHAINVFNAVTIVEPLEMTIDELLIYLPQLTERVQTLDAMRGKLPRKRERSYGSGLESTIDYRYSNYDIEKAAKDYEIFYQKLSDAQIALDKVNNTVTMKIDL